MGVSYLDHLLLIDRAAQRVLDAVSDELHGERAMEELRLAVYWPGRKESPESLLRFAASAEGQAALRAAERLEWQSLRETGLDEALREIDARWREALAAADEAEADGTHVGIWRYHCNVAHGLAQARQIVARIKSEFFSNSGDAHEAAEEYGWTEAGESEYEAFLAGYRVALARHSKVRSAAQFLLDEYDKWASDVTDGEFAMYREDDVHTGYRKLREALDFHTERRAGQPAATPTDIPPSWEPYDG